MVKSVSFMMTVATAAEDSIVMLQTSGRVQVTAHKIEAGKDQTAGIPAIKLAIGEGSCADNVMIKSEDECKAAAEGLGIEYLSGGTSRDHNKKNIKDERPGGCYSVPRGGKALVYFNDRFQAGTSIWPPATGVCHLRAQIEAGKDQQPVLQPKPPLTLRFEEYMSSAGKCTKEFDTAVRGNYLTDGGNETFNKYKLHKKTNFTHMYTAVHECQEKCLAIPSCAGFVDNRDAKYCVFKEAMVTYPNEAKHSWICSRSENEENEWMTMTLPSENEENEWMTMTLPRAIDEDKLVLGLDGAGIPPAR